MKQTILVILTILTFISCDNSKTVTEDWGDGRKVIKNIYRKEQIYSGPYLNEAADLILVGEKGFNLKSAMKSDKLTDRGIFSGKHTQDTAFLITRGLAENSIIPDAPSIYDIKGIIEKAQS